MCSEFDERREIVADFAFRAANIDQILCDAGFFSREVIIFHDLIEMMAREPITATRDARLLFVAKHLERIGDYVTDICELNVYMTEAAIIKHKH